MHTEDNQQERLANKQPINPPLVDAAKDALALGEAAVCVGEAAADAVDGVALVVEVAHDDVGRFLGLGGNAPALFNMPR